MNDKPKALVWFTGVLSQYKLSDDNLDNISINYTTLRNLEETYDLICIICVPSEEVKQHYLTLVKEWGIQHLTYIFIPYEHDFTLVMQELLQKIPNINTYIDYSKARLVKAAKFLKNENVIHVSQLMQ